MIKNKIIFGLILLLSACTTSEGRYGILTSRPTPLKYFEQNNHVIKEQVTMSASEGWFLFIPYGRGSSAYGYAQAQDPVWEDYLDDAGSFFSDRDDFVDALDFIAWYMTKTKEANGISLSDAYNQYLNYHEGWNGFKNGSYRSKDWLLKAARSVQQRADSYKQQLLHCDLY